MSFLEKAHQNSPRVARRSRPARWGAAAWFGRSLLVFWTSLVDFSAWVSADVGKVVACPVSLTPPNKSCHWKFPPNKVIWSLPQNRWRYAVSGGAVSAVHQIQTVSPRVFYRRGNKFIQLKNSLLEHMKGLVAVSPVAPAGLRVVTLCVLLCLPSLHFI